MTRTQIRNAVAPVLTAAAVAVMTTNAARDADWQLYLCLLRLVTDDVPDPESRENRIGVVCHGQAVEEIDLLERLPDWTSGQLRYRVQKLVAMGMAILSRAPHGRRLALRFSNQSRRGAVPLVSIERFGWLCRPVQLPLVFGDERTCKPLAPAMLPLAA